MPMPEPAALETTLDDDTRITFRPIRADDKGRLSDGLRALSPESRYRRFFRDIDHFTPAQLRYLTEVDFRDHFAWIGVLTDRPGSPGVGVGRWVRLEDDPGTAEAAVTVVDTYHGRGIGRTLLWLMARSAIERGINAFRAWTLGTNAPMLELLREFGAVPGEWDSGVLELRVPLPESIEHLELTPAPLILKATARGELDVAVQESDLDRTIFG
jgi:GNAT superfamily N-acetyltransferase